MPLCVKLGNLRAGLGYVTDPSVSAIAVVPISVEDATQTSAGFSCSTGSHLLLTVAEVNALEGLGSPNAERMADMQSLFYAFLLVLVLAWGAKQLLNLFSGDTSRD